MKFKNELLKKKILIFNKEFIFYILIIFFTFIVDRFSKNKIISRLSEEPVRVNDFINFDLIWNTGIGFGLLSFDSLLIYNLITVLIGSIILTLFYVIIISESMDRLIFSMIIGGALGNFYDRLVYNAVPDFIDLHYNAFHWFTFNMADIFITLGITLFLIKGFIIKN